LDGSVVRTSRPFEFARAGWGLACTGVACFDLARPDLARSGLTRRELFEFFLERPKSQLYTSAQEFNSDTLAKDTQNGNVAGTKVLRISLAFRLSNR
jgi:hypothetical protein